MKKSTIISVLAAITFAAAANAQDLNPTVEITNTYEGAVSTVAKPVQTVSVPDSVMRFSYDFDYAVSPSPYKGAYEFTPYIVSLRPLPKPSSENSFYLRAGAGYALSPEADLIWTPLRGENCRLNITGAHDSFIGNYHGISLDSGLLTSDGTSWSGFDGTSRIGADFTYAFGPVTATFDAAYRNSFVKDNLIGRNVNGASAGVKLSSTGRTRVDFDAELGYRFNAFAGEATDHRVDYGGSIGMDWKGVHKVLAKLGGAVTGLALPDGTSYLLGNVSVAPHYVLDLSGWHLDLGVKLSVLFNSKNLNPHPGVVFPDASAEFRILDDVLVFQASATGGDNVYGFSDMFARNHFVSSVVAPVNSIERIRASVGVRGNIADRFQYNLKAGYARESDALTDGILADMVSTTFVTPDYNLFFADLKAAWQSTHVDATAHVVWNYTDMSYGIPPAALKAELLGAWHWGSRLRAGAWGDISSARVAADLTLPGYVDLGIFGEAGITSSLSAWLKLGNLLCQTIQATPLHARRGLVATAGICLNF